MPDARELICQLHAKDGGPPIGKLPGVWHRKLDERWRIFLNGHMDRRLVYEEQPGLTIGPADCYVEYNGWPAGIWNIVTGEGCIAAGEVANYETFCQALQAAVNA